MPMINPNTMKSLFKPYHKDSFNFQRFLDVTGLTMKKWLKIQVESECSKSIDESCINTDCQFNYLNLHQDELYIEVFKEVEADRKAVEERTKRDMAKYYGTNGDV